MSKPSIPGKATSGDINTVAETSQRRGSVGGFERDESVAHKVVREELADCAIVLGEKYSAGAHTGKSTRRKYVRTTHTGGNVAAFFGSQ